MQKHEIIEINKDRNRGAAYPLAESQRARILMQDQDIYNGTMPLENVRKVADADFPTRWGHFRILGFEGTVMGPEADAKTESAVALVMGDIVSQPPIVRIHSQCLTGDVFHSLRCDCRQQLELALEKISEEGSGVLLYEQQEGRGIGLMAKLKAYELQDQGLDTVEANIELGFKADCREFELPAAVLKLMGVGAVRLITNNPEKVAALEAAGIAVVERLPADVEPEESFRDYLRVKREKMGHLSPFVDSV
jgi:GTP cyclohydrolase II